MSRSVFVAGRAQRHLNALPQSVAVAVGEFCEGPLAARPWLVGKPLHPPLAPLWTARVGDYRILYTWTDSEVRIEAVRHRRDAYRS